ncbi:MULTISPECIES: restriction endonuclease subunit S [Bacteroides]|uniref:Putative type I restriction endonuclease n=1 Tax=Bacteroides caccae TaxID=47678 RepID=A0A174I1L5_9BACE|nr:MULTISPECIES: restriction endonuclease subunit S [Bacteroides]MBV4337953.1 restriction endonuclease subunit S [Bacteroides thetaiotaomicron]MCB7278641.1 restriction endonuclease subunit S [Bacteroides thetaiotaomicron]MCB7316486.1 restriction endonuclease subunit S [Bacteroides thetaiotaomicron]MCG4906677.1 restriction endonuclease subunit S [Bacteroides thetaiotaomicron]CUO79806.1 putative type I restriction endonuclease [Bacteroides caccae]
MGNVPNLRFPEFSEEWKKMKVSELLDFYSTNSLSWEQLDYNNGKIKNLHYGLIHKGVPTMVDVVCDSLPYIKEESMPKSFTLFKEGDVAFADASEDTNDVAKAIEVVNCDNQQIVSGLHTIHGRDNYEQTIIGYKGYAFASDSFHKQIRRIAQGTKVFSISARNFDEVYIGIPSKEEQTKIAKLLIAIDKRIATQNKIIEKLQSLIRGLAVTLTTKGNFNTAISQCLECHSSTLQESEVLPNGLYKVFGANGLVGYTDVPQMNGDAILVIKDGSGVGTVSYAQGKFSAIGTLNYLTVIDNNDLRYLYFALSVFNFQAYKTGMAIPHIYFKDYGKAKIYCPPLAEQKHIANVLDKLESKLLLEQGILASFNWQKRYLLGQMLI